MCQLTVEELVTSPGSTQTTLDRYLSHRSRDTSVAHLEASKTYLIQVNQWIITMKGKLTIYVFQVIGSKVKVIWGHI